jgi:isopenicillin-N N-acyltransferase-like protein
MNVLHVYGTPYEMGYAHGTLLKDQFLALNSVVWKYMVAKFEEDLPKILPKWLADVVAKYGLAFGLDITYEITKGYTGAYIYEEMKGISDASGGDYLILRRIHMIGYEFLK